MKLDYAVEVVERAGQCDKHGPFVAKVRRMNGREYGGNCELCSAEEMAEIEARERQSEYTRRVNEACVPMQFRAAEAKTFLPEIAAWISAYRARSSQGPLFLCGPVGTGKTHTAICVLKSIIRGGSYGMYLSAIDYGRRVRETWTQRREETERSLLNRYSTSSFLVLDEIGANRSADDSIIQDLICARYDADMMRSTIIVTNLAAPALDGAIGERAADRIRQGATLVALTGASVRRPAA